jgi:3-hydroxyanthranilate 3,4-dioxygenase
MILRVVEGPPEATPPRFRDIIIREGDMFLLPGSTPHSPIRFADTVGVVVEQRRPNDAPPDRLRWYCGAGVAGGDGCGAVVHDDIFVCTDLGTQVKAAVERFREDDSARKCSACGRVAAVAHRQGANRDPNA